MPALNWSRSNAQERMRRQGFELAREDDDAPVFRLPPGKRWAKRLPKSELRAIAAAALKQER